MSAETVIAAGRARAEALMHDFGVMRSPTGRAAINDDGLEVPTFRDEFSTVCKVGSGSYVTVEVGGVQQTLMTDGLSIPVGSPTCVRGWVFEVTQAGAASDPRIVGRRYLVHNDPASSMKTARRLDVIEVTA